MRYPILTISKTSELANQLLQGLEPTIDAHVAHVGTGEDIKLGRMQELSARMASALTTWTDSDRDRFEGRYSTELFGVASETYPLDILDDPGFWRYLSIGYFWDFIAWREAEAFGRHNHLKYVDCSSSTESVLTRMFLRGAAVGGSEFTDLAGGIPRGTDFWRSHIIRVRTGSAPPLTRAFAERQRDQRLSTDPLRSMARAVNRVWSNVVLDVYEDDEAADLISEIAESVTHLGEDVDP